MRRFLLSAWVVGLLVCIGSAGAQEKEAIHAATPVAEQWLGLVDKGLYNESWDMAAAYFKGAITQVDWQKMMEAHRLPLGKMVSRTLKSSSYQTSLPGAPDGHYVVFHYQTVFQNKATAAETVIPMKDKIGLWRIAGYYIK